MTGLQGSTAVPFVFPPVLWKDRILMDGGVAWNLDITSAIHKCRELVDSDDKIILDVIDVDRSYADIPDWDTSGRVITNYFRYKKIQ
jgi:predicted acylesterase/phospholipase RssA